MIINDINILNFSASVLCKSSRYTAQAFYDNEEVHITSGINKLDCDIDGSGWAVSYMLSMYKYRPKDIFWDSPEILLNGNISTVDSVSVNACYMDEIHPIFSRDKTVRKLIEEGIKKNRLNVPAEYFRDMFAIDKNRFERKLSQVGNERFRCMSAIGCAHSKSVFCFPWLSKKLVNYYGLNLQFPMEVLQSQQKIVVFPTNHR